MRSDSEHSHGMRAGSLFGGAAVPATLNRMIPICRVSDLHVFRTKC